MTKVSVIIPVYNAEEYLTACLESITGQTFDGYEVIIVNDGSTDNSQKIIDDFEKRSDRIKSYTLKNGGVSKARNFGVSVASGEYIVFVDADDDVAPEYLSLLYENRKEGLTLCAFNKVYLDRRKKYVETWGLNSDDVAVITDSFLDVYSKWLLNTPWNKLFEKNVIEENGIKFKEGLNIGEDLIFNMEYLLKGNVKSFTVVNKPLYNYYVRNAVSNSTRFDYTVCEKVLMHREYVSAYINDLGVTDRERVIIDKLFLEQLNDYLYMKLDKEQMLTALKDEKLRNFLKATSDGKYRANVERGKYNSIRRKYRMNRKLADIKARIKGVR